MSLRYVVFRAFFSLLGISLYLFKHLLELQSYASAESGKVFRAEREVCKEVALEHALVDGQFPACWVLSVDIVEYEI